MLLWKQREFKKVGDSLVYYKRGAENTPKGSVPLRQVTKVRAETRARRRPQPRATHLLSPSLRAQVTREPKISPFAFVLHTGARDWVLAGDTKADTDRWCEQFGGVCGGGRWLLRGRGRRGAGAAVCVCVCVCVCLLMCLFFPTGWVGSNRTSSNVRRVPRAPLLPRRPAMLTRCRCRR